MSATVTEPAELERAARLEKINAELTKHGLNTLPRLGVYNHPNEPGIEFMEIVKVYDYAKEYFTDVQFSCRYPGGGEGLYTVRFKAESGHSAGAVMVVVINGKFAIIRSFRPAIGRFLSEFPRGFSEKIDTAKIDGTVGSIHLGDLPLGTVTREIGEEVLGGSPPVSLAFLGGFAENTGTHATIVNAYLVQLRVEEDKLQARLKNLSGEGLALQLWSYEKLLSKIGDTVSDAHTMSAFLLYQRHIAALPSEQHTLDTQ